MEWWSIDFGRERAPKNAPRWVWRCGCAKCAAPDSRTALHGPFKTKREAERDAERTITLLAAEPCGGRH